MATITPTTIALAAEAFTRCPGLTPTARRVGHELLNYADRNTGLAWPSEARLAEALGVTTRSIRRAKAQLQHRGLLTWKQRGRQATPVYELAWKALVALARRIKAQVKKTAARFKPKSPPRAPPSPPAPGRTSMSSHLPQKKYKSWDERKKQRPEPSRDAVQRQTGTDRYSTALLQQRAHTRLWTALTAQLSVQNLGNLIDTLSTHPDIEARAITVEQHRWGSGLPLLLKLASEKMAI